MRRKLIITPKEVQSIIDLYIGGKQQREIAKQFNCGQSTVSNILNKNNIKTRVGKNIIYTDINLSFFKKIDNEENAYFLGFLYADGCVQIKNSAYSVTLKLKSDDQIILEKFRNIMSPSSKIKITGKKYSNFRISYKSSCEFD